MPEETTPKATQRKQQPRSLVTKQKLLVAAVDAFAENGYKGTSTRDIADRAGVHHPLITYHFRNKEQLWRGAADFVFRDFTAAIDASMRQQANACPKARMTSLIHAYVHYTGRQPALHRLVMQEASTPGPRLEWLIAKHLQPLLDKAFVLIEKLQLLGIAPSGNPRLLFSMIRMTSGALFAASNELRLSSGIDTSANGTLDEIADMIIRVFLPGQPQA